MQTEVTKKGAGRWLALGSICLHQFLASMTLSSVIVAIPAIAENLHADAIYVSWIPTAFLLSSVIMLLPAGKLADIFGRKRLYLLGSLIFAAASALGAFATSIEWLLVLRFLQGAGSAFIWATGLAIIMDLFLSKNRGLALGLASASVYVGLSCGPLIGGWLTQYFGWRSVFSFPVPLILASMGLAAIYIRLNTKNKDADRVDWIGSTIFAVSITSLLLGVSNLTDPSSWPLIVGGFAGLGLFFYQQARVEVPLINFRRLVKNHVFFHSMVAGFFTYASNYPMVFLLSLYLQYIQGLSPSVSGQLIVLQVLTMAIISPFSGRLSDHYEPRILATAGCLIMSCGFLLLQQLDMDTSLYLVAGASITLGIGFGLFTTPNNNAAMTAVDRTRLSMGSALLNLSRVLGNVLGTAMVLVVMAIVIGNSQISPDQYPALMTVIRWALAWSFLCTLAGAWFSYARGNVL
jgi:EmrB/QacA subfamily drug resistance transporter